MAENYKHLYESMKRMVEFYQDEILPQWRDLLDKNHLGVEDAVKVLISHCKSKGSCKGCRLLAEDDTCFFTNGNLPCDWKLEEGAKGG